MIASLRSCVPTCTMIFASLTASTERTSSLHVARDGFLDIRVFSGPGGVLELSRMKMVGRRDHDRVDIFQRDDVAMRSKHPRIAAMPFLDQGGGLFPRGAVWVAQRRDLKIDRLLVFVDAGHVRPEPLAAAADDPGWRSFVRALDARVARSHPARASPRPPRTRRPPSSRIAACRVFSHILLPFLFRPCRRNGACWRLASVMQQ